MFSKISRILLEKEKKYDELHGKSIIFEHN